MTSTVHPQEPSVCDSKALILKTDTRNRVRIPDERREALLREFDSSGLSGKRFARLSGIKYSTFQYWLQSRKRRLGSSDNAPAPSGQQVSWLEAVVQQALPTGAAGLVLQLPGGVRAEIASPHHVHLAVALVRALEKPC